LKKIILPASSADATTLKEPPKSGGMQNDRSSPQLDPQLDPRQLFQFQEAMAMEGRILAKTMLAEVI
jgi:hypothetical protein